jgi:hypothetical protein
MGRMIAQQMLHFSWHALPLTFVRKLAPETDMKRSRSRNDGSRNSFGMCSDRHPKFIRMPSDLFMSQSRFPKRLSLNEV